jgi:uncharacterized protein YbbC (DUF1343 family)
MAWTWQPRARFQLYGASKSHAAMLRNVDVLVFDIRTSGCFYTI